MSQEKELNKVILDAVKMIVDKTENDVNFEVKSYHDSDKVFSKNKIKKTLITIEIYGNNTSTTNK